MVHPKKSSHSASSLLFYLILNLCHTIQIIVLSIQQIQAWMFVTNYIIHWKVPFKYNLPPPPWMQVSAKIGACLVCCEKWCNFFFFFFPDMQVGVGKLQKRHVRTTFTWCQINTSCHERRSWTTRLILYSLISSQNRRKNALLVNSNYVHYLNKVI